MQRNETRLLTEQGPKGAQKLIKFAEKHNVALPDVREALILARSHDDIDLIRQI